MNWFEMAAQNPFAWYRTMRESQPVYYDETFQTWQVFRYQDVQRVLMDYEAFSSQMMQEHLLSASMINNDPPRHRQLRSLVTQAFTPRTVAQLAPRIDTIVHELLDKVAAQGQMDIIDDLSYPLPVMVIAEMLGVPIEDRERFRLWSDIIAGGEQDEGGGYEREITDYFLTLLEQRRSEPREDLLTALQAAEIDGQRLTPEELISFCVLLLVAGNITTTNLIGNTFVSFDEFPAALEQLYADPSLVPAAIEEVLRYRSPVSRMFRFSIAETTIGGQRIEPGRMVVAWIGSANRDPEAFPDPDTFDIQRNSNRHIAFGHGIHYCLGAPLARLETKIVLEVMLKRCKEIRVVPGAELEPVGNVVLHGFKHVPVTFKAKNI